MADAQSNRRKIVSLQRWIIGLPNCVSSITILLSTCCGSTKVVCGLHLRLDAAVKPRRPASHLGRTAPDGKHQKLLFNESGVDARDNPSPGQ